MLKIPINMIFLTISVTISDIDIRSSRITEAKKIKTNLKAIGA